MRRVWNDLNLKFFFVSDEMIVLEIKKPDNTKNTSTPSQPPVKYPSV